MTDKARIRIAAAVTALFIAGISAAGVATRDDAPRTVGATAAQPLAATPAATALPADQAAAQPRGRDDRYEADDDHLGERGGDE